VTFDAADPHKLAHWWSDLLHYRIVDAHDLVTRLLADGAVTETEVARIDGRLFLANAVAASDPKGRGHGSSSSASLRAPRGSQEPSTPRTAEADCAAACLAAA
jgi:hypothetical protein